MRAGGGLFGLSREGNGSKTGDLPKQDWRKGAGLLFSTEVAHVNSRQVRGE